MTKGTPLLYYKVKLTKINGLFMKISARSNKSDNKYFSALEATASQRVD